MAEIIKTPSVDLNIDEFTYNVETDTIAGTVSGDGIFDTLMETATKHLLVQFESNRIRQEDYATAYIHIYEVTLQAALKAWLEKDLIAAQIRNAEAQTAKVEADTAKIKEETKLLPAQLELIQAQTAQVEAETTKVQEETKLLPVQLELTEAQITKLEADTAKVEEETKLLPAQLELVEAQVANETAKLEIVREQLKLVAAQVDSEKSKSALYKRQIESFDEDYKQKILKIMMDSWAVGFSIAKDNATISVIPDPVTSTKINSLYAQIAGELTT